MPYKHLFFNDYSEGAHPRILEALLRENLKPEIGYGEDTMSLDAASLIKTAVRNQSAEVHFVSGGTQANLIALASMLKPYESVIAAYSAHINMHEAGAIEATGHKVNTVKIPDGKLTPQAIRDVAAEHSDEHMVKPRAVFVSQATELGTVYKKAELAEIAKTCRGLGLYLYLDGARLGSALASVDSDMGLDDIASLVDMFYIGGTKNGALVGEALVIVNPALQKDFRYHIKQHGGLLAKGRLLGTQFRELFTDGLFLELGRHANQMAAKLSAGLAELGYQLLVDSSTNQIFPIMPKQVIDALQKDYGFYVWGDAGEGSSSIRLVTSWATTEQAVIEFLDDVKKLS